MMGRQTADQAQLFYSFNLDERIPKTHLLRRIDVFVTEALAGIHSELAGYYSHTGRPSIDPELLMRMLIVGYCYGIRSERRLCEEVALNLAYRCMRFSSRNRVGGLPYPFISFLSLVEEAPVGALGDELLRGALDHPDLVQAQGVEAQGVLGAVLTPLAVGDLLAWPGGHSHSAWHSPCPR